MVVAVVAQEVLDILYYRFPETVKSKLDEKERIYVDSLIGVCCDVSMKSRTDLDIRATAFLHLRSTYPTTTASHHFHHPTKVKSIIFQLNNTSSIAYTESPTDHQQADSTFPSTPPVW